MENEGSFNPVEQSSEEDIKRKLSMYRRDLADHAEGVSTLDPQSLKDAEYEVKRLEAELEDLEKAN